MQAMRTYQNLTQTVLAQQQNAVQLALNAVREVSESVQALSKGGLAGALSTQLAGALQAAAAGSSATLPQIVPKEFAVIPLDPGSNRTSAGLGSRTGKVAGDGAATIINLEGASGATQGQAGAAVPAGAGQAVSSVFGGVASATAKQQQEGGAAKTGAAGTGHVGGSSAAGSGTDKGLNRQPTAEGAADEDFMATHTDRGLDM